jgi:hypothetical protein
MNDIIQLTAILFILSMICERMANFLKLKLSDTKTSLKVFGFGNMKVREPDESLEKDREYRILKLNIICGILTALALKADLVGIVNNVSNPQAAMGWAGFEDKISVEYILQVLIGCSLTGLFISLGSKFWHDLLDTLLYFKNMKKSVFDNQEIKNNLAKNPDTSQAVQEFFQVEFKDRQDENDNNS